LNPISEKVRNYLRVVIDKGDFMTNTQIVQKAYADFGRGDVPAIIGALAENVEWITPGQGVPTSGTRHGKAAVTEFFKTVAEAWDFKEFNPREFVESGDTVVAIGDYTAVARSTGRTVRSGWVMVWRVRGGKVEAFREYTDTQALVAAATAVAAA
jgi:ketosteroid isomerase-like protein